MSENAMSVILLPDETTLQIFSYLSPFDVLSAGLTCTKWHLISKDDCLWRRFMQRRYPVDKAKTAGHVDYCRRVPAIEAYRSAQEDVPRISIQHLRMRDMSEILHVGFSKNGRFVCSTSKSGRACLWEVTASYRLICCQRISCLSQNGGVTGDCYCFYSEFNEDDSLLLLCAGGIDQPSSCVIYVYNVTNLPSSVNLVGSLTLPSDAYASWEGKAAFRFGEIRGEPDEIVLNIHHVEVTKDGLQLQGDDLVSTFRRRSRSFNNNGYVQCEDNRVLYSSLWDRFCPLQVGSCCCSVSYGEPYFSRQTESIRSSGVTISRSSGLRIFAANQVLEIETFPLDKPKVTSVRTLKDIKVYPHNKLVEVAIMLLGTTALVPKTGCLFTFLDVNCKNYLASGNFDSTVQIWNRCSGALVATLVGHKDVVNAVAFNPVNDHMLVSVGEGGDLRVWHSKHLEKYRDKQIKKSRTCCII